MGDLKFTKSHEWVKVDQDTATIGISDYAQSQLGDIVFIELPQAGEDKEQSSVLGTIESTKTASELYVPISGRILEVNEQLVSNPQWINESPYENGWMVKIKPKDAAQIDSLMDEAAYKELIAKET